MKKTAFFYSILIFFLFNCEERIDEVPTTRDSNQLVVEAMLTNENTNHKVKLSHPYQQINGTPATATGAVVVIVEGSNKVFPLVESPMGSGEYFTEKMIAVFGRTYTLLIRYNGKEYFAQARSVPVEALQPVNYEKVSEENYQLVLTNSGADPNYVEHRISWGNTPACTGVNSCQGLIIYYDLKTIDVQEIYKPDKIGFSFPENSIVVRTKFSVAPEYKDYLRSVLSETEWRGGIFDVQRANAKGNISGGAVGFFAVSSVVSDTTIILKKP